MENRQDKALGLLLDSVRLDSTFAPAHVALAVYAVPGDYAAAWRHARGAERNGDAKAVDLLRRHGIEE